MKSFYIILYIGITFPFTLLSQEEESAFEMEEKLKNDSLTDAEKLKLYDLLSWKYHSSDFHKSLHYAHLGLQLAEALHDETTKGYLYLGLGTVYHLNKNMDSAAYFFRQATQISTTLADNEMLFMINNAFGNLYSDQALFEQSLEYYQANLRMAQTMNNQTSICYSLVNIGVIYMQMHNYPKAEEFFLPGKDLAEKLDYQTALATVLINLDEIYIKQGEPEKGAGYCEQAAQLFNQTGYYPEEIRALLGLARSTLALYNDYPTALLHTTQALQKAETIGYGQEIALCHRMFCIIYYEMNDLEPARQHALEALQQIDSSDYHNLELLKYLIQINIDQHNAPAAKNYFQTYEALGVRYNNQQMQRALSEMDVKYETEKREIQIATLSGERKLYALLSIIAGAIIITLLLLLLLYDRYQRLKRLQAQEHIEKLKQEKLLIAAQSLLDGENHERERLSRELHDGLGGLLTMIRLNLTQIASPQPAGKTDLLPKTLRLIDKSITEMRRLAHNLMPESLARFGLKPVLEEFCNGSERIHFHFFGTELRYEEKIEIHLYRIASELINNALKHSDASEINVQLILLPHKISLTVSDNGKGLGHSQAKQGLTTVRSRAKLLAATLQTYTQPLAGTEITVELTPTPLL
jgi:signal transduction histidine kinase